MKWRYHQIKCFGFFTLIITFSIFIPIVAKNSIFTEHICDFISIVESDEYNVTVTFQKALNHLTKRKIKDVFAFETNIYDEHLLISGKQAKLIFLTDSQLILTFPFPFITKYKGKLKCKTRKSTNVFPINVSITQFSNVFNFSQMKCFGRNYLNRYCDGRNIGLSNKTYYFYSPIIYSFPHNFICLSGRSPPFDRPETHLKGNSIIVSNSFPTSSSIKKVKNIAYIFGRFYNSAMLWHMIYDNLVPLYSTIITVEGYLHYKIIKNNRHLILSDDEYDSFMNLFKSLTLKPIKHIDMIQSPLLFTRVVIGLQKLESNIHSERDPDAMFRFKYNYNNETGKGLRAAVLEHFGINPIIIENQIMKKPLIIIQTRDKNTSMNQREITNIQELIALINKTCNFCEVKQIDYGKIDFREQIYLSSIASVIIGQHGSGLSHVAWMHPSQEKRKTYLLEILPYMYNCRDWYKSAANLANVEYYSYMPENEPKNAFFSEKSKEKMTKWCWNHQNYCDTFDCHDVLRDQNIEVELETFSIILKNILNEINYSH
ncbi:hypothetical protein TRFO_40136 [Tritrichomonas foetus]|uniref:Glycosyltransferase 61 catalytic domain-containing protein n=1 Tax=Tritrichomonas foetus TaxID=1144522 RepID=A0A1J4J7G0_9EUKA|nr:hypothetical protein TRFO_40136 [Tritrichomonas foetus]|eukprot:OHS93595.1 hypothetical protein TRFO_40136 [Tritrichomonas foetus]